MYVAYRWNNLIEPILKALSKPLLTELDIQNRLEGCVWFYAFQTKIILGKSPMVHAVDVRTWWFSCCRRQRGLLGISRGLSVVEV